jgi:hypothetical protein
MRSFKAILAGLAAVSTLGLGMAAVGGGPASAYVACNAAGECWHADGRAHYDHGLGIVTHPDDWYFHQHWDDHRRWHDYHDGRGYWRNGVWITF